MSSDCTHAEVHSIEHYVIMLVSDMREVGGFHRGNPVSSNNNTDRHDINEVSLKVTLNTMTLSNVETMLFDFQQALAKSASLRLF